MSQPGRPREPEIDQKVLKATLQQLACMGYSRMSIDQVAILAGTTKPAIYRRWASKEDLATAALAFLQTEGMPQPTGDVRRDLIAVLKDFQTKLMRPNGMAMIGTLLVEEKHNPLLLKCFRERIVGPRRRGIMEILVAGQANGQISKVADLEMASNLLVGGFYAHYLTGKPMPKEFHVRSVDLVLAGLRS
jgi:AcrR family transcriptional regulator